MLLSEEGEDSIGRLNHNLTMAITAAALGEAACRKQTGKLTQKTKGFVVISKNIKL